MLLAGTSWSTVHQVGNCVRNPITNAQTDALVYKWYHRQFWEAAEKRYLSTEIQEVPTLPIGNGIDSFTQRQARHLALAKYFSGEWSSPKLVSCIIIFSSTLFSTLTPITLSALINHTTYYQTLNFQSQSTLNAKILASLEK
jgi:hypothetical protein